MESTNVFGQLRSLARRLDHGVVDIQKKVADPGKHSDSDSSYAHAYRHLQEVKKEVQALKDEAREKMASQQISTYRLQQVLDLLPRLIASQRRTLTGTEDYLEQYGYVKQAKKTTAPEAVVKPEVTNVVPDTSHGEGEDDNEEEPDTVNDEAIVHETTTPPTRVKPSECKTPRLEDFGLSDLTLNILQKGRSYAPTQQHVPQTSSLYASNQGLSEDSPTPALFKHNGLFVTPSLMGGRYIPQQTPDCNRIGYGFPQPMFTEDSPTPFMTPADKGGWRRPEVRLNSEYQGSPVPPVLNTPGAKQIHKQLYREGVKKPAATEDKDSPIPPLLMTPGMKQITKTITAPKVTALNSKPDNDSPMVPVLMTPGVKQIQKTGGVKKAMPVPVPASSWDKEPEMPEFTLSLQDITQLTQSFRLNNSTVSNPPEAPALLAKHMKDRDTPPLPELLSTRLANLGTLPGTSSLSSAPHTKAADDTMSARILKATQCDTPPPPTLFGKYNFTSKYKHRENVPPQ
ncbi:uncharacterized protein LOC124133549 [Haliotis rufescens]|uniref:uncharacterized protein LOC124133549 n=1 Tax=Haliotis rufescens TaxID=6454 RepID=UPI00201ED2C5|nr:uncharacterized protein LOC124133549 [Haliotis rufescens]